LGLAGLTSALFPCEYQAGADYNQCNACGWGKYIAALGVDADVGAADVNAVVLGVGYGNEEGKDSQDQDY